MTKSELDEIKGIGIKTKEILLKEIGSIEKIKKCSFDKLEKLIGTPKAGIITRYLQK
jgi:excinuclease ABC subunit C